MEKGSSLPQGGSSGACRSVWPQGQAGAVSAILLGACLWGVAWYPMRLLEARGLSGVWLTLILYLAAALVTLPWTRHALHELRRDPLHAGLLMLAAGWTNLAFVLAVLDGNVMRMLMLFYLSPVWATLMGWLFLRERIGRHAWVSLAIAMTGAGVMLWDPAAGRAWPEARADWLALSSGFAFSLANVIVRKSVETSLAAKAGAVWIGVVLVTGAMALWMRAPLPVFEPGALAGVVAGALALGILGIVPMTLLVQYGVSHLPMYRSAVLAMIELVAGVATQQWLTDEVVTGRDWAGGGLIVWAAWLAVRPAGLGQLRRAG